MNLIKTCDELPIEDMYVLVWLPGQPWIANDSGVFWKVAKLVRGISIKERLELAKSSNPKDIDRSISFYKEDEHGNNEVPYYWSEFGIDGWFGQEVLCWAYLPTTEVKKLDTSIRCYSCGCILNTHKDARIIRSDRKNWCKKCYDIKIEMFRDMEGIHEQ